MAELEMTADVEAEDFTDDLSDEALDRDLSFVCFCPHSNKLSEAVPFRLPLLLRRSGGRFRRSGRRTPCSVSADDLLHLFPMDALASVSRPLAGHPRAAVERAFHIAAEPQAGVLAGKQAIAETGFEVRQMTTWPRVGALWSHRVHFPPASP